MPIREIVSSLLGIFILMVPGFVFRKCHLISEKQSDGLTSFVVNLTWPCLVISGMQMEYSREILRDSGYALILCVLVFAAAAVLSLISIALCIIALEA